MSDSTDRPEPHAHGDLSPEDPEDLDEVGQLLVECLTAPRAARNHLLERRCAEHPHLAQELRGRLGFLAASGLDLTDASDTDIPNLLFPALEDFELLDRLAVGGMGVVHRARQRSLDRIVALKFVRPELLLFDGARERFRREAAAVARLEHPGIVPVYAAGEAGGVPYIAMQLVSGTSLARAVEAVRGQSAEALSGAALLAAARGQTSSGPEPEAFRSSWTRAVVHLAREVAEALAHVHARGLVHRDVKPSNILVDADGRARLIDFGLTGSEGVDTLTRTGSYVGTLHYLPPERLRGERALDARGDVYSLGVTLYELLALAPPFDAPNRVALERMVLDGRVVALRARNRAVDAELERVCLQAMAPEPSGRYASAQEFADDLGRWLAGKAVHARGATGPQRARRWVRRNKALTAAIGLGALLAVGLPSALYGLQRRHNTALQSALDAERVAVQDLETTNDIITRVLRDTSPAHKDGPAVTLLESLGRMAALAEAGEDSPRARARVLSMVGQIRLAHSAHDDAQRLLESAEARLRANGFAASPERVLALERLGDVARERGDKAAARERYAEAAALALGATLDDEPWAARLMALEAATYMGEDNATAARLLREALTRFRPRPGNSDDQAWTKRNRLRLAQLEGRLGNLDAGYTLIEAVRGEYAGELSLRDTLELAAAESDLAFGAGDPARAAATLRPALDAARAGLGERNAAVASLAIQLARALLELGQRDEARGLLERAHATRLELFGPDSPATQQVATLLTGQFPE